ncbi:MAG TPA: hypothetical protein VLA09_03790 [Longimicrobiales bacterium]|nr:hypothetical protein [Longimicrobiales bacterium]
MTSFVDAKQEGDVALVSNGDSENGDNEDGDSEDFLSERDAIRARAWTSSTSSLGPSIPPLVLRDRERG